MNLLWARSGNRPLLITASSPAIQQNSKAIVELANAAEPPLRLPLGTDTLRRITEKNAFVQAEAEKWRVLAASTDY